MYTNHNLLLLLIIIIIIKMKILMIHNFITPILKSMVHDPCNLIGSQQCDLFMNCTIFCSKLHPFSALQNEYETSQSNVMAYLH